MLFFFVTVLTTLLLLSLSLWSRIPIGHQTDCVPVFVGSQFWETARRAFWATSQHPPHPYSHHSRDAALVGCWSAVGSPSPCNGFPRGLSGRTLGPSPACLPLSEFFCQPSESTQLRPRSGTRQVLLLCLDCSLSAVRLTGPQTSFRSQLRHGLPRRAPSTAPPLLVSI